MEQKTKLALSGAAAGAVNGFFGAGGGMVLVPLLEKLGKLPEEELFPASLRIMVPICALSLFFSGADLPLRQAMPYLAGSFLGGLLSGKIHVPTLWLHRILGILILAGGGNLLWR